MFTHKISRATRAFILACIALFHASQANAGLLALEPNTATVAAGDSLSVDLVVSGLGNFASPGLGGFTANVGFDPAVFAFAGYTLGTFLGDTNLLESLDIGAGASAAAVDLGQVSLLTSTTLLGLQPDSFTLATLDFSVRSLAPGQTTLIQLAGGPVLSDTLGGTIGVAALTPATITGATPVVTPATPLLMLTALSVFLPGLRRSPA